MEDILASIRKIIADEDVAPSPSASAPAAPEASRPREAVDLRPAAVVGSISPQGFTPRTHTQQIFGLSRPLAAAPVKKEPSLATGDEGRAPTQISPPTVAPVPVPAETAPPVVSAVSDGEKVVSRPPGQDKDVLVSATSGNSIAAAFQTLATSVALTNADVIDRQVRDLLRPMLRTWLDDNLPVIVEKLVRVEIERVARGGR